MADVNVNVDDFLKNKPEPKKPDVKPEPKPVVPGVSSVSPEQVRATIGLVMRVAAGLSKVTDFDFDDRVIAFLEKFVNEPWFAEVVAYAVTQFEGKPVTENDFKVALASFKK